MTKGDCDKVFTLLRQFYRNARQLSDKTTLLAWELALERFPYDAVKNSVLDYAARNKFFPDLADITAGLPLETAAPADTAPAQEQDRSMQPWMIQHMQKMADDFPVDGCPLWSDAKESGMPWSAWVKIYRERGGFSCSTSA